MTSPAQSFACLRLSVIGLALLAPGIAASQDLAQFPADIVDALPGLVTGEGFFDAPNPDMVITLRGGVQVGPAYLGAKRTSTDLEGAVRLDYIRFPNGFEYGSGDAVGFRTGWGLRGSARSLHKRDSGDYSETEGLDDIPWSLELGLGVGYEQKHYRAFADVRYGFIGHNAWVGDVGVDGIAYPVDGLTLTLGPRLNFGSDNFSDTYFGVSASEAAASGMEEFDSSGGLLGAGVEFGMRYLFNQAWGVEGAATWSRLLNDAGDSPITGRGSDDQYLVRLGITRRISLDF